MDRISVSDARKADAVGRSVRLQGWVRTRRDSKGGFSFIELNDGSSQGNVQVVAPGELANYEAVVKKLPTGASVSIDGEVKASPAKGQATEVLASRVELIGDADVDTYPLQKKGHSFEFLRGIAHLRPRTNTFGAVARVRHQVSMSIHQFFHERGFFYVHTPVITASDCEGAGAMFRVSTIDPESPPKLEGKVDYKQDFFGKPAYLTVSGQLQGEAFACGLGRIYTFGPTFRAENSNTRGTSPSSG
jgi:asparaginyl-tRNA synthetase